MTSYPPSHPGFSTNVRDDNPKPQEPTPIRSHEEIMKHNWFWFKIGVAIFIIGLIINYHIDKIIPILENLLF